MSSTLRKNRFRYEFLSVSLEKIRPNGQRIRMTKRAVWVHKDYFDETPDRVTWIEMINHLARLGWDITLLTGFRKERLFSRWRVKFVTFRL